MFICLFFFSIFFFLCMFYIRQNTKCVDYDTLVHYTSGLAILKHWNFKGKKTCT